METLLWVLLPLLIIGIGWWALTRARKRNSAQVSAAVGPETARESAALLGADAHRAVYRNLAQGNLMGAVQDYRKATGQGLKQSIIAVRSLEAHPQVHHGPQDPFPSSDPALGAAGAASSNQRADSPRDMDPLEILDTPSATGAPGEPKPGAPTPGAAGAGAARNTGGIGDAGPDPADTDPKYGGDAAHTAPDEADGRKREQDHAAGQSPGQDHAEGRSPEQDRAVGASPGHDDADQAQARTPGAQAPGAQRDEAADSFTIPDDWADQFGSGASRKTSTFRISAEKDGEIREFGTDELPPAEYDQFQSLLRDKDFDGAASLLAHFSGLDRDSIRQLLETAPVDGPSGAMVDNISDFSFEGDGPDGHVQFSASDLPEADRHLFLELVGEGRIADAAQIVHRHTGLPADMVEQLLTAFGKK